jgi:hypothetical protein
MLLRWGRAGKRAFVLPLVIDGAGSRLRLHRSLPTD